MLTLLQGDWVFTIDLDKRIGRKIQNRMMTEFLNAPAGQEDLTFDKAMMAKIGGQKIGEEKMNGFSCEVWEIKDVGTRTWYWKWIPLKMVITMGGAQITIVATKVTEGADIQKNKFLIPAGIQFMDQDINEILLSLRRHPVFSSLTSL